MMGEDREECQMKVKSACVCYAIKTPFSLFGYTLSRILGSEEEEEVGKVLPFAK
jgi:hypothetical protein